MIEKKHSVHRAGTWQGLYSKGQAAPNVGANIYRMSHGLYRGVSH